MKEKRRINNQGYYEVSTDGGKTWSKTTMRPTKQEEQEYSNFKSGNTSAPTTKKGGIAEKVKFTAPVIGEPTSEEDIVIPGTPKRAMPNITPLEKDEYAIAQLQGKQTGQTPFEKSLEYSKTPSTERKYGAGLETILGAAQAGYGLQQLMKDKRPVYETDPALIGTANQMISAARYGYTPEQKAALMNDIVNTRIAQQAKINQLAGGSAGVGLANAKAALNDELMNKYKLRAEDEQLRMNKLQGALGASRLLNAEGQMKFQNKMNEFMQKQQAGAELLGAGIQNVVGARRYQREREAQDQINKMMYGNTNLG
jgi:hypothetical protein